GIYNVIFFRENRETRNLTDNERNEKLAREGKIAVHYAESGKVYNHDTPNSEWFSRDIMASQAKQDNRERQTKTIDGMLTKAENGWYPSNRPGLGYAIRREIDPYTGRERSKGVAKTVRDPNPR